jgi:hypothetical protein
LALPLPPPGPLTLIHGDWLVAVHAQLASFAETVTTPDPPSAAIARLVGVTVKRQGAGACETVNCCAFTSSDPLRARGTLLGCTLKLSVPLPVPPAGEASVIQAAPDEADQVHSRAASIVALPLPPNGPNVPVKPVTEIWHLDVVGATTFVDEEPHAVARRAAARVKSGRPDASLR